VAYGKRPAESTYSGDICATTGLPQWRQWEMLAARGLLRALLAKVAPASAEADLVPAANGKPMLDGWPRVGVSLSHDIDVIAAAVGVGCHVGVDIQLPPDQLSDRIIYRCMRICAPDLLALTAAERATEFAWMWSVQEACVKCDGSGISGRPWTIDVPLRPRAGRWRDLTWITLRDHTDLPVSCAFGGPLC